MNVWELVYPFKKEAELQKKEINKLRDEMKRSADKQGQILSELEHTTRMLNDKDEDYKRHTLNYENSRRTLEMELIKQQEELDILREKGVIIHKHTHSHIPFLNSYFLLSQSRLPTMS